MQVLVGCSPRRLFDPVGNNTLQVLDATSLWRDIDAWMDGDMTMIGERGVTLSGGQKARISVARATYRQDDIVLVCESCGCLYTCLRWCSWLCFCASAVTCAGSVKVWLRLWCKL